MKLFFEQFRVKKYFLQRICSTIYVHNGSIPWVKSCWVQSRVGLIPCGFNLVGFNPVGSNPLWVQSLGCNSAWVRSRAGSIPWVQSRGYRSQQSSRNVPENSYLILAFKLIHTYKSRISPYLSHVGKSFQLLSGLKKTCN